MKTNDQPPRIRSVTTLLCAAAATLLTLSQSAQAGYMITLRQVGPNVAASGSGAIDLTGLTFVGSAADPLGSVIFPSRAVILAGPAVPLFDGYTGLTGPTNFGSGGARFASSDSGDLVGIIGTSLGQLSNGLGVPHGYLSGTALSDSAIYDNATFSSLGLTPGTYEWTWGTGANQNFTLRIGTATVPDSGSTFDLLLLAVTGLFGLSRLRSFLSA